MAALSNPVNKVNIASRVVDYVSQANTGIGWGTNSVPTYTDPADGSTHQVVDPGVFGGTTSGITVSSTATLATNLGTTVKASEIVTMIVNETNRYTRIRNLRAILSVTGTGGNNPQGPVSGAGPGVVYDATAVAHMNAAYANNITQPIAADYGMTGTSLISATNLENYISAAYSAYLTRRGTTTVISNTVCHASCHNSCHNSRSRR